MGRISGHELQRLATEKLGGMSPREAGRQRAILGATWVYRWGWAAPSTIDLVASPTRRGLAARLVRMGWAASHPTPGTGDRGVPARILTLTPLGLEVVEAELPDPAILPYPTRPEALIPWHQLRHDALVQLWTARRLAEGKIDGYVTPRELTERSTSGTKQPDVVWRAAGGKMAIAVELELTAKKEREMHQAALAIVQSVHPGSATKPKGPYDAVAILSHSEAILDRYRRLLRPGAVVKTYTRDQSRHWRESGEITMPAWIEGRVLLEKITL